MIYPQTSQIRYYSCFEVEHSRRLFAYPLNEPLASSFPALDTEERFNVLTYIMPLEGVGNSGGLHLGIDT
jgi:hypothetical protein